MPDRTTGGRDELSQRLRALRKAAGLSGVEAATRAAVTQSKMSRVENGRVVADPEFVDQLARLYGASPAERRDLVAMAKDVKGGTRRLVMSRDSAGLQARLGRIERQSALVRCFSPSGLPGELQTEEYVRAVFYGSARRSVEAAEAGITQRLLNQAILDDEHSPRQFVMILPEGSLGWALLPPPGMAEQVDRLTAATYRRNVRLGIIPWGSQCPVLPLHSWYLFDARFVVTGVTHGAFDLAEPADVDAYVKLTDQLEQYAVFGDEARAILVKVADRYRGLA
jgi:transcriptional regulator with XRE-family HTH domain